jgi:hypothetical protein
MWAVEEIMRSENQLHSDDERAREWLKRRLEWEGILSALREASRGDRPAPVTHRREPTAA